MTQVPKSLYFLQHPSKCSRLKIAIFVTFFTFFKFFVPFFVTGVRHIFWDANVPFLGRAMSHITPFLAHESQEALYVCNRFFYLRYYSRFRYFIVSRYFIAPGITPNHTSQARWVLSYIMGGLYPVKIVYKKSQAQKRKHHNACIYRRSDAAKIIKKSQNYTKSF